MSQYPFLAIFADDDAISNSITQYIFQGFCDRIGGFSSSQQKYSFTGIQIKSEIAY